MRKSIVYVMVANIVCLIVNVMTNFLLPKYLSVESYAMVKTYALYITYAGFFSLGYNDGMYLKYGGKNLNELDTQDIANNFLNYTILEVAMLILLFIVGFGTSSFVICAFAFGMFSTNLLGYLKSLYQSTGEFKAYGKALNVEKILVFVISMILIFTIKTDNSNIYVFSQVGVSFFSLIILLYALNKRKRVLFNGRFLLREYLDNITSGFILMLGNFTSIFFTGIDRWFVKFLMDTSDFALYSFAVSMENIINAFLTPITVSLYNYFCQIKDTGQIKKVKNWVLIWGFVIIGAAFPAKFILEYYLIKYIDATSVMFLLFAAQAFHMIVKGIYVNVYKAEKRQDIYLKQMISMIILSVVSNAVLFWIFRTMQVIAIATLFTSVVWFAICEFRDKSLRFSFKEYLYIVVMLIIYLISGVCFNAIFGFITYYVILVIITVLLLNKNTIELFNFGRTFVLSWVKKNKNRE